MPCGLDYVRNFQGAGAPPRTQLQFIMTVNFLALGFNFDLGTSGSGSTAAEGLFFGSDSPKSRAMRKQTGSGDLPCLPRPLQKLQGPHGLVN